MTTPASLRFALILSASFGLAISLGAAPAWADAPAPRPLAQSLAGPAKEAFEIAQNLLETGDFVGAGAKYKISYDLSHDPRLLYNMALCEKEQRHSARAAALLDRYLSEDHSLSPDEEKETVATRNALRKLYSSVKLSAPDGARVAVDGIVIGSTPLAEPPLLEIGHHTLRVERVGFEPYEAEIDVPGGNEITVSAELKPLPATNAPTARLSIASAGERDIIAVDGRVVGSHRWQGTIESGIHSVRVTAPGKKAYETSVPLTAGASRSLQVSLEDEASGSRAWLWVTGGVAVAAGAVVGGYFLFKPQDKPGPHPEGSISTVYLPLGVRP